MFSILYRTFEVQKPPKPPTLEIPNRSSLAKKFQSSGIGIWYLHRRPDRDRRRLLLVFCGGRSVRARERVRAGGRWCVCVSVCVWGEAKDVETS